MKHFFVPSIISRGIIVSRQPRIPEHQIHIFNFTVPRGGKLPDLSVSALAPITVTQIDEPRLPTMVICVPIIIQ